MDQEDPKSVQELLRIVQNWGECQSETELQNWRSVRDHCYREFARLGDLRKQRLHRESIALLNKEKKRTDKINQLIQYYQNLEPGLQGAGYDVFVDFLEQVENQNLTEEQIHRSWEPLLEQMTQAHQKIKDHDHDLVQKISTDHGLVSTNTTTLNEVLLAVENTEKQAQNEELRRETVRSVYQAMTTQGFRMQAPRIVGDYVELIGEKGLHEQVCMKFFLDGQVHEAYENYTLGHCHQDREAILETLKQLYPVHLVQTQVDYSEPPPLLQKDAFDRPQSKGHY